MKVDRCFGLVKSESVWHLSTRVSSPSRSFLSLVRSPWARRALITPAYASSSEHTHTRHTWAHHRHTQQHSWIHASESHPVYAGFACIHLCWGPAAWARPPACCPPTASPAESSTTHTHTHTHTADHPVYNTAHHRDSSPENSNLLALRSSQIRMSLFLHQVCRNGCSAVNGCRQNESLKSYCGHVLELKTS